jgi:hypothetical protein
MALVCDRVLVVALIVLNPLSLSGIIAAVASSVDTRPVAACLLVSVFLLLLLLVLLLVVTGRFSIANAMVYGLRIIQNPNHVRNGRTVSK